MDELTAMIFMTVTIFAGILLLDWVTRVNDEEAEERPPSKNG